MPILLIRLSVELIIISILLLFHDCFRQSGGLFKFFFFKLPSVHLTVISLALFLYLRTYVLQPSYVLFTGLLFRKFRFGWKTGLHAIPQEPSDKPSLLTFMVVIEKESSSVVHQIACSFDQCSLDYNKNQVEKFVPCAFGNEQQSYSAK